MRTANALLFAPAALWTLAAGVGMGMTAADEAAWKPVAARGEAVGSADCQRCHAEQHRTWHRSYHRTMTQDVREPEAIVLAPFEGETLEVAGFVATFDRSPDGVPRVQVERGGQSVLQAEVEFAVGSHRYQQYVARLDRGGGPLERWRLPFAWHPRAQRWIHLGGAFLFPDLAEGDTDAYLRHFSRWNDNCVFCHNTEPVPGLQPGGGFETEVAEVGIGCEACHGPAQAHVARQSDPFRRMLAPLMGASGDGSVTHPGRLEADRHSEVCGRCHGQRIGRDVAQVLAHGDGFLPGTPLTSVSRPILADERLASDPPNARPFAERFWPDGTPRLSAYEYQGLLLSPCHDEGRGLSCGSCHTMHGDEPDMQLRDGAGSDAACVGACHDAAALQQHGGHTTVTCQGCHMPRVTYGLLRGMASHRITSPDPGAWLGRDDMPDACTQCHVDQTRAWAAEAMPALGLRGTAVGSGVMAVGSRAERDLVGGDPVQRALAAHALARPSARGDHARRVRALVDGLEDDYPAVRWFAHRGLSAMVDDADVREWLGRYDFMADAAERIAVVDALRAHLGPSTVAADPAVWSALLSSRDDAAIAIGE
jgi:hypothetical protein